VAFFFRRGGEPLITQIKRITRIKRIKRITGIKGIKGITQIKGIEEEDCRRVEIFGGRGLFRRAWRTIVLPCPT
jgi:hypothetical protein